MARRDKLIERILARPAEAPLRDVQALLEAFGFAATRQKGSHVAFTRAGELPLIIPLVKGRRVRRPYLEEIIHRLELEE